VRNDGWTNCGKSRKADFSSEQGNQSRIGARSQRGTDPALCLSAVQLSADGTDPAWSGAWS